MPPSTYQISSTLRRNPKYLIPYYRTSRQTFYFSTNGRTSTSYRRFDFAGQGYAGAYEATTSVGGPPSSSAAGGVPKINPRELKKHLDQYVVGQERSKVVLATALYNHYLLSLRRQRLEDEEEERLARKERIEHGQTDYPEPIPSNLNNLRAFRYDRNQDRSQEKKTGSPILEDNNRPIKIQKSNILMLGPTGVGKTLIVQ